MTRTVGRNDSCPCGSGKKYKKCCLDADQQSNGNADANARFRFEPGTYGGLGSFMPSIACIKETTKSKEYYFILSNQKMVRGYQEDAFDEAERDLEQAFAKKGKHGHDMVVAEHLKGRGYVKVQDFKFASDDIGYSMNPYLTQAITEVLENQLAENDPSESRLTLQKLVSLGKSEDQAKRLLCEVILQEIGAMVGEQEPFDLPRYVAALERLVQEHS